MSANAGMTDSERQVGSPARAIEAMESDLRALLASVEEPHLRELLGRIFGEGSPLWGRYRIAPAAKRYHQAYQHGLLEHCLTVAEAVSAVALTFAEVDRDVAVTGALLHDIGKLEAYGEDAAAIDLTDVGRLQGEIALGYYIVRREIERIEGFPEELAWEVLHIVLSHHGSLEYGSPVVPCTREATLVHMIDNLGGRLGSFDRVQREMRPGQRFAPFDRALRASAFFARGQDHPPAPVPAAQRRAA
jgi:3'-5' exoribonuclease